MARPIRIAYQGAFYHVTDRGNEARKTFLSRLDYGKFLSYLTEALDRYGVILHAFVLLSNHYQLLGGDENRDKDGGQDEERQKVGRGIHKT